MSLTDAEEMVVDHATREPLAQSSKRFPVFVTPEGKGEHLLASFYIRQKKMARKIPLSRVIRGDGCQSADR